MAKYYITLNQKMEVKGFLGYIRHIFSVWCLTVGSVSILFAIVLFAEAIAKGLF